MQTKTTGAGKRPVGRARRRRRASGASPAQLVILRWLAAAEGRSVRQTYHGWFAIRLYGPGIHPVQKVKRASWQIMKDRGWIVAGERVSEGATLVFDGEQQTHVRGDEHYHVDWTITPRGRGAAGS